MAEPGSLETPFNDVASGERCRKDQLSPGHRFQPFTIKQSLQPAQEFSGQMNSQAKGIFFFEDFKVLVG